MTTTTDSYPVIPRSLPTGIAALDDALGIGGLPTGRVVEVFGRPGVGCTTLALSLIATAQGLGEVCAYVDVGSHLSTQHAVGLGVDLDTLLVSQPADSYQALGVVEDLVASGAVGLLVVDGVHNLQVDGDKPVGLVARLLSRALRTITGQAGRTGTTVVFVNQLQPKLGVTFGPSEVTSGGNALRYYSSVRLHVRRASGGRRIRVVKNKLHPPFAEASWQLSRSE